MFETSVASGEFLLAEGSVYERLRRTPGLAFDPSIAHAGLIYDALGEETLQKTHQAYLEVGRIHGLPMTALTDTWRAGKERIAASRFAGKDVNADCARFLLSVREDLPDGGPPVYVGGVMGCKGDAYKPGEALDRSTASEYHAYHIDSLAGAGVDFLLAATLPALSEASGIADAMASTDLPYVLSFVLTPEGTLLDGNPLYKAVDVIDQETARPPTCYSINCVHPDVCRKGLEQNRLHQHIISGRISCLQANTSALRPDELDGRETLDTDTPEHLADGMWGLYEDFGLHWLGGCCGTDTSHIKAMAGAMAGRMEN